MATAKDPMNVELTPIAPSSAQASKQSSSSRGSLKQAELIPTILEKATKFTPNVLPQLMKQDEKEIGGIYDKRIHRNNWAIDTSVAYP
jgi:hypothetical protein